MQFVDPRPQDLLRLLRAFGWTQAELAKEIGVQQCAVSRIINGLQMPRRSTVEGIMRLAEAEAAKFRSFRDRVLALYPEME